jgi:DNA-binding MarR family transcriptional regulator
MHCLEKGDPGQWPGSPFSHKILSVEKNTTTRLVNPLVNQGLVVRQKLEGDSRAINLSLTQEGKEVYPKARKCLAGFI